MRPMGWCADLVLSSLDLLATIVVIIPNVVRYVSWYHLLALWRDSCCLEGSRMRSRGPIRLNLKGIRWPLPVLWVFCRWVRLVYVDKGIGVVLPSAA